MGSQSQRQYVTIMRFTMRSDVPKKLNSDNEIQSKKIHSPGPLLCSSLVFSIRMSSE